MAIAISSTFKSILAMVIRQSNTGWSSTYNMVTNKKSSFFSFIKKYKDNIATTAKIILYPEYGCNILILNKQPRIVYVTNV